MARAPQDCQSMTELRVEIDRLDAELVAALARRAAYIDRAVALKQVEDLPARITWRVQEVQDKVAAEAARHGLPEALVRDLWGRLIEWSIARESKVLHPEAKEAGPNA
ncbi:chorismate mutase [Oceanomicrobium pacificus]|uniref:chorismate mutase n=1 Tax=Oceanomicrobium pacificus TaxID=2692916 RepID=A0A6B0TQJ1_9RHOB|nr:chorismate mutase [Oceanomicrobium pacificus]MXU64055.1 chorismate mutase [Oceanomicrobium pacificus]